MSQLSTDVVYHILAFNANYNSDIPLIIKIVVGYLIKNLPI